MPSQPRSRGGGVSVRHQFSAHQRRAARLRLGPLRDRRVTAQTLGRYRKACSQFFAWADALGLRTPDDRVSFDTMLTRYPEALWQEGEPRGLLANVLCGLAHEVPSLHGSF